ncbi:MAG: DNA polymerase III PolC-type [Firmicutes bacterium ADurb.Bin193]|nr:MAG: DNA polymerase III PolC-type [Firmicutes bacterium ADurb.Bin193]
MDMSLASLFSRVDNKYFENSYILKIVIKRDERSIILDAFFNELVPFSDMNLIKKSLCEAYELSQIEINPKYPPQLFNEDCLELITEYISEQKPVAMGTLSGAKAVFSDGVFTITLKNNGIETLLQNGCDELAKQLVKDMFGLDITVEIVARSEIFEEYEKEKSDIVKKLKTLKEDKAKQTSAVIYGHEISGNNVTPISDIVDGMGRVTVKGELFAKEITIKEIKKGKYIVSFGITDFKSSIYCKLMGIEQKTVVHLAGRLKKGVVVTVRGQADYDDYIKEVAIAVDDINEAKKEMRTDTAEVKRVELHMHTKMSYMDAMTDVQSLVDRAVSWGHKAVAITDHGVVQAFPYAVSKIPDDFKVIFGMEAYLVDAGRPIAFGGEGRGLTEDIVVFDTETTGLNPQTDRIIEIGAVKITNGEISDRFSTFVNPGIPISEKITELTRITDEMVADAETIESVLPAFLEFCGGAVLVAHNASFDMGFLRANAERLGISFSPDYIDTVEMARGALPELDNHKLNIVAKALGISLEGHHRAVNDAEATAQIYLKLADSAGVNTVDELNEAYTDTDSLKNKRYSHAVIIAKNYTGLKNLYKIVSESHLKYFNKKPLVPKSLYFKLSEGLIIGSACEQGEVFRAVLNKRPPKEIGSIVRMYDYLEIQPLCNNEFLIRNGAVKDKNELIEINKRIIELGEYYNKPVVATCDVHFLDPVDSIYRAIIMAGMGYSDADEQAPLYFRTTDEMFAEFDYLPPEKAYEVVVENTNKIADMCEKMLPVPKGTFPPVMGNSKQEIIDMCNAAAHRIYGENLPPVVKDRMDKELAAINKYGFSVMYLIAQKLVAKSHEDGYLVGSRGSVGSSFVAFLCGITEVNALSPHYICKNCKYSEFVNTPGIGSGVDMPDKDCPECGTKLSKDGHNIPFETFLGFEGDKEPDIDLNFSGDYQPKAHKYTEELFGEGHVFRAGTISTLADRTAYGFVKGYLEQRGIVVSKAEENRLVEGCSGVKRTTGQHPGGVMILPKGHDIHEFCPIQHPADDMSKGVITTHFDYESISGRLLKLDILGHDDPTMIKMLEDLTGVDAKTIPLTDPKTMSLFTGTEALGVTPEQIDSPVGTFGVPELGTRFVRQMLVETKPTTFAELVRISGLSHGTDVWTNNAQELVKTGTATLREAICTRDDIMTYLIEMGLPSKSAFDIMEHVRKGMGLSAEEEKLMRSHGVPEWYINSCNKIKYMFPKAHAVAYVSMALRVAWFKVHHPLAFYLAHFTVRADEFNVELMCDPENAKREKRRLESLANNEIKQKDKNVLTILEVVIEMFARGIKFLPVDLYKSDASKFLGVDGNILPPLCALAGLGQSVAESIVEQRQKMPFSSIEDLYARTSVSKTVVDLMRRQGCLDGLPESDQVTFF